MAAWLPRTLLDVLRAGGLAMADANPAARCGCGRVTAADMLVDVRPLPAAARAAIPHGDDYACDGCTARMRRATSMPRAQFAQYLGAPAAHVARLATLDSSTRIPG